MLYADVLLKLNWVDFSNLPGHTAHQRLAPDHRKPAMEYLRETNDYRTAAVLALVAPDDEGKACLVLIQRTGGSGVHADQVSFPGGKQEAGEELVDTAIREAMEEIGVNPKEIQIFGPLSPLYIPPSKFLVYPFLATVASKQDYLISEQEVVRVLEIPIAHFLMTDNLKEGVFSSARGYHVHAPYYHWEELKIWGATAMMISEIADLLYD